MTPLINIQATLTATKHTGATIKPGSDHPTSDYELGDVRAELRVAADEAALAAVVRDLALREGHELAQTALDRRSDLDDEDVGELRRVGVGVTEDPARSRENIGEQAGMRSTGSPLSR